MFKFKKLGKGFHNGGEILALQRFPEELWRMIWKDLGDPETKLALLKSNLTLWKIFQAESLELLFPFVIPLVLDQMQKGSEIILKKTIQSLRLVSSRCCTSVDKFLDSYFENFSSESGLSRALGHTSFYSKETIARFLYETHVFPIQRNHILGKYVTVQLCLDRNLTVYLAIQALLKKLGKYLNRLHLDLLLVLNHEIGCEFVQGLLKEVPGLKTLQLEMLASDSVPIIEKKLLELPELPKLTQLTLEGEEAIYLFQRINFHPILKSLTKLEIDFLPIEKKIQGLDEFTFPNLEHCKLSGINLTPKDIILGKLSQLPLIPDANSLKKLEWNVRINGHFSFAETKRLGKALLPIGMQLLEKKFQNFLVKGNFIGYNVRISWVCLEIQFQIVH